MTTEQTQEPNPNPNPYIPLPDPTDMPLEHAAASLARCMTLPDRPVAVEAMLRQLHAAMAEFSPGGNYRTPDVRLAAQVAVLDSMFQIGVQNAIRFGQILVEKSCKENNYTPVYKKGSPYLDKEDTLLALKLQNSCRRTIEGLKLDATQAERVDVARIRANIEAKRLNK